MGDEEEEFGRECRSGEVEQGSFVDENGQVEQDKAVEKGVEAKQVGEGSLGHRRVQIQLVEDFSSDVRLAKFSGVRQGQGRQATHCR